MMASAMLLYWPLLRNASLVFSTWNNREFFFLRVNKKSSGFFFITKRKKNYKRKNDNSIASYTKNVSKKISLPMAKKNNSPTEHIKVIWKLDVDPQRDDDASPMSTYRCMLRPTWMISALQHKSKYKSNSISKFFEKKKIKFFGSHVVVLEDLSIDVSITNVGLILTKLRWFQLFVKSQNSNFELFEKKIKIFGFPWCSTRDDLSIDVSITNVGLILTKLWWYLFSGCGQTRFWNPHMETCRHTKKFNSKLKISG